MSAGTSIEWTEQTWNPVRGCTRVSPGCVNCYAERMAGRFSGEIGKRKDGSPIMGWAHGFAEMTPSGARWTRKVALIPEKLAEPLSWRSPRMCFVNSTSDLFHEALPFEDIAAVWGVMAACPHITFQVLTKRPERAVEFFRWLAEQAGELLEAVGETPPAGSPIPGALAMFADDLGNQDVLGREGFRRACHASWPLPNVWLGTSIESQDVAIRAAYLLECPAAVHFVSLEPLLGPVDLTRIEIVKPAPPYGPGAWLDALRGHVVGPDDMLPARIAWAIFGGESGPGARPLDIGWVRAGVQQCREAGTAPFVKQMGSFPVDVGPPSQRWISTGEGYRYRVPMKDRKGGDPEEWPAGSWPREFPTHPY